VKYQKTSEKSVFFALKGEFKSARFFDALRSNLQSRAAARINFILRD